MYRASYNNGDGEVFFYDDHYPLEEYRILDPTIELKDSAASGFAVTIPPTNIAYDKLFKMFTEITIYDDSGEELFDGRILSDDMDFDNNKQLSCEGGLAYLIDTSQPQMEYHDITLRQFVESVLSFHNQKVSDDKKFYVNYISNELLANQTADITLSYRATQFESTLDTLNQIIKDFGGHIKYERKLKNNGEGVLIKKRYISIISDNEFQLNTSQSINFGENLLEFAQGFDMSKLCTVVMATGQRESSPDSAVPGDNMIYFPANLPSPINKTKAEYDELPEEDKVSNYYILTDQTYAPNEPNMKVRMYKGKQIYLPRQNMAMIIEKDDNVERLIFDSNAGSNYYTSEAIAVEEEQSYFISSRLDKFRQYVIYIIRDKSNDVVLDIKQISGTGSYGTEDLIKSEVKIPVGGGYLYVCGMGTDIPIQVQKSKPNAEKLDTYLSIMGARGEKIIPSGHTIKDISRKDYDALSEEEKMNDTVWYYILVEDKLIYLDRVYKDKQYLINPDMVESYGWIEKTASWSDCEDSEDLMWYAFSYLFGGQWDEVSIELTAFDMKLLGMEDVLPYKLYQRAWVTSAPHGLDRDFPIQELSIPLLSPESTTFKLGAKDEISFTEASNAANVDLLKQILSMPSFSATLESAKANAASLINMATSGVVTLVQNENGAQELLIHDGPNGDYHKARHVWRWNINGLGYGYDDGAVITPDKAYTLANTNIAITSDGHIVANFITAGVMSADRIRGGNLKLTLGSGNPEDNCTIISMDDTGNEVLRAGDVHNPDYKENGLVVKKFWGPGVEWMGEVDYVQIYEGEQRFYINDETVAIVNGTARGAWEGSGHGYVIDTICNEPGSRRWLIFNTNRIMVGPDGENGYGNDGGKYIDVGNKRIRVLSGIITDVEDRELNSLTIGDYTLNNSTLKNLFEPSSLTLDGVTLSSSDLQKLLDLINKDTE